MICFVVGIWCYGLVVFDFVWVVVGWFDGFWESDLKVWDIVVGMVFVCEVGGVIIEMKGGNVFEIGLIIFSNVDLYL